MATEERRRREVEVAKEAGVQRVRGETLCGELTRARTAPATCRHLRLCESETCQMEARARPACQVGRSEA